MSRDLVNHNKWSWFEIDGWNGKGVMKLVGFPTFKCKSLGQFESLKIMKKLYAGWQRLSPSSFFFPTSLSNFLNIKITVKCRTLTSVTSKLKILLVSSCSLYSWYLFRTITIFMIDKVTWHSYAKGLLYCNSRTFQMCLHGRMSSCLYSKQCHWILKPNKIVLFGYSIRLDIAR